MMYDNDEKKLKTDIPEAQYVEDLQYIADVQEPQYIEGVQESEYIAGFSDDPQIQKTKRKPGKFIKTIMFIMSAVIFGIIAGASFQGYNYFTGVEKSDNYKDDVSAETIVSKNEQVKDVISIGEVNDEIIAYDVSDVVENVIPSIVAINAKAVKTEYDFFGRPYSESVKGSGSGIIIGQNGSELLIVTNNHVVDGAEEVEIIFVDDVTATAVVKGSESRSDLAVLSVPLKDLTNETKEIIKIAKLGDSKELKLGELAIAIGNALGYGQSVTVGYISALDRKVNVEGLDFALVQTDAAINPGNSGGALLNSKGELIGINSVKYASSNVEGMGFAIPISDAIPVINELMDRETLDEKDQAFLGIILTSARNVTEADAKRFSMPIGIYINEVVKDSPADKAGLKQGDIIIGFNQKSVETIDDLINILSYTRAGEEINLITNVLDNGEYIEKVLKVRLSNRPLS
ncbi:MAG TPA: trypsin-like serine protease [Clostridiales bacterium]|nr:trypsin-like serine protease [Clostridiales bacterium]